jgi:zinc D-Ala-D-Ala carboxypeptidase
MAKIVPAMKLSKNFTLEEMLESQTARRKNIEEQFQPTEDIIANLKLLCKNILQPLRDEAGAIMVSSGYRCPRLNKAIGGSKTSQHRFGQAADIKGVESSNAKLFAQIKKMKLPFDQLIWEFGTAKEPAWVHVSFSPRERGEILFIGVK